MATKGKTYRRANPRDTLARLMADNPKAGKNKLRELFIFQVLGPDGKDTLLSVAEYWFATNYDRLKGDQP